jgi:peptidoglycan/xylan/chitin deacetylase (PgdA/CDA1 family)
MGIGQRIGRLAVTALLAGTISLAVPAAADAAPPTPPPPSPLVEGPWPPSEVLAADPAMVAPPAFAAQAATASCPAVGYGVNHAAPGPGKTVALTFDDGPGVSTAAIEQVLRNAGVTATFFNIGINQTVRPALVQDEAARGFLLGNHTWSHPDMSTSSAADQASEMDRTTAEQISLVGSPPCFFRPPYGSYNSTTLSLAQARNMSVWNWSVDTEDWKAQGSGDASWVNRIVSLAQAGGSQTNPVILMHNSPTGNPATVAALPTIISYYRDRGYRFVDLAGQTAGRLPFGAYDSAAVDGAGNLTMWGWAIDPDTPTQSVAVHLYVDGVGFAVSANQSRPDVGAVYPVAGSLHGFGGSTHVGPGTHTACAFAIDTADPSLHTTLGCRSVTFAPVLPFGAYDSAAVDGAGLLSVSGWAIDPDTATQPVAVHVYVDGVGQSVSASGSRPDVGAVYPAAGSAHGFLATSQVGSGAHQVCVFAIDSSVPSEHTTLGCRTETAP